MFDVNIIRQDFPILSRKINNKQLTYLDNAATSQKPQSMIDSIVDYYQNCNANIHRGIHTLSEEATAKYEESKEKVAKFINAKSFMEIIYTRNATESINLVAYTWGLSNLEKGDSIILSEMEHHSNMVIWQQLSKKVGFTILYIPVKDDFTLDLEEYTKLISKNVKLVSLTHASNVLGTVNDVKYITKEAHKRGATVLVDGAQSAPHFRINVQDLDCDFFAFAPHKMCGPMGLGILYGKKEILQEMPPFLAGGGMIKSVSFYEASWNNLPDKFEAGTPNVADGIAFGKAIEYLEDLGMENIAAYEKELVSYALKELENVEGLTIFGLKTAENRDPAIAFSMKSAHPHDISEILNEEGIAVRSGHHCMQPLHDKFKLPGSTRASFYFYNTKEEVDKLILALKKVNKIFT